MARRSAASRGDEVTDLQSEPTPGSDLTLETGVIFATLVSVVAGLILCQIVLSEHFDSGLFGG